MNALMISLLVAQLFPLFHHAPVASAKDGLGTTRLSQIQQPGDPHLHGRACQ